MGFPGAPELQVFGVSTNLFKRKIFCEDVMRWPGKGLKMGYLIFRPSLEVGPCVKSSFDTSIVSVLCLYEAYSYINVFNEITTQLIWGWAVFRQRTTVFHKEYEGQGVNRGPAAQLN